MNEIINSIAHKMDTLGLKDSKSFWDYYGRKKAGEIVSELELELLSPDSIDNAEFWKECDKRFIGSVCGEAAREEREMDIAEQNWWNRNYAHQLGITNYLVHKYNVARRVGIKLEVLEIGPGYGALVNTLCQEGVIYNAIDVNPRFEGVYQCDGSSVPTELKDKKFHCVIASNVFQHLSINQRRRYYTEILNNLSNNGIFSFTCVCKPRNGIKIGDREFICHMGQYTELQSFGEILGDLTNAGLTLHCVTSRADGNYCFHTGKVTKSNIVEVTNHES